jgi:multicomponent Na+:H+ antiporter subunit E
MKRKIRSNLLSLIPLILFWFLLVPSLEPLLVVQGLLAIGFVLLFTRSWVSSSQYSRYHASQLLFCMPKYIWVLFRNIYRSAFSVIATILKHNANPGVVEVPIQAKTPLVQTLIANAITLTPGTITLDIQDTTLFVLSIDANEETKSQIIKTIQTELEPLVLPIERRIRHD